MSDFHPLTNLRRFVADLTRGQTVIPAEHLAAAEELRSRPVVAADWDLAPGMTWHPSYIATLTAEFGRELDRLDDVLTEWGNQ